jgi:hypothetical protein
MSVRDKAPRFLKATIHIGKPLCFDHLKDVVLDDLLLKRTTDSVMLGIAELTGEEYRFAGE